MKLISFNVRGLGSKEKIRMLRRLTTKNKPWFLLIQETKLEKVEINITRRLWYDGSGVMEYVASEGNSGGLITVWDDRIFVAQEIIKRFRFMVLIGELSQMKIQVVIVNVYAPNDDEGKRLLWGELRRMMATFQGPWLLGGDFNAILNIDEHTGRHYNVRAMHDFQSFVNLSGLIEVPMRGGNFTCCTIKEHISWSKLDRFLFTPDLLHLVPDISMQRLPNYLSDYNAIALLSEKLDWRPSPFRFYDHWLLEEGFDKLVSEAWVKENSVCAWSKLRNLKNVIKEWKKSKLNTLDDRINMVEKDLAIIDARWTEGVVTNEDKQSKALLTSQLWKLFRMEEMQWKQKSRLKWLKCGDKNTRFFHTTAKIRKRNNNVEKLMHKDRLVTDK